MYFKTGLQHSAFSILNYHSQVQIQTPNKTIKLYSFHLNQIYFKHNITKTHVHTMLPLDNCLEE